MKVFYSLCFLSFSLLFCPSSLKAEPSKGSSSDLVPRRIIFGNPEKASPSISPDGTKLAYLAPDESGFLNVWVKNLDGTGTSKKLTSDSKRGIRSFMWQKDNKHILYFQDHQGDENSHIYQTSLDPVLTKELTPFPGVKVSPLSYDYRFPDEMLIIMNKRNPELYDVYKLNLKTGEITPEIENPGGVFSWVVDHQNKVRYALSYDADGSTEIRYIPGYNQPWQEFMKISPLEEGAIAAFSPDNESVYFIGNMGENTERLFKISLDGKKRELVWQDPEYDIEGIMVHPTTDELEAVSIERDKHELIVLDKRLEPDMAFLKEKLKSPFVVTSRDKSDQNWIVIAVSDKSPAKYYHYNRKNKTLNFLFTSRPKLAQYQLSSMEPITFEARDGMKLHGYLTLPAGKEPKDLPTILYVHGGPWVRDYWGFNPVVQWLANRGYAVLQINYRGSTGYGKKYVNAGNREWGGKMQTDLIDGKDWLVKKGYADPKKVAIYGGSYGGYATLAGLAFTPEAFCCGVDVVGPSNLITLLNTFPPYWMPLQAKSIVRMGDPKKDEAFLKERSPLYKANDIIKPLLIAQGANDPRVKQAESDQIVAVMRKNNQPVEYLLFSDEGHGFANPENQFKFYAATEDFLSKYLGGEYEAPSKEDDWESLKR